MKKIDLTFFMPFIVLIFVFLMFYFRITPVCQFQIDNIEKRIELLENKEKNLSSVY